MNIKKLSRLFLATVLTVGTGVTMCAQAATSSSQTLQCTLAASANITPDGTAVTSATIAPTDGTLSNPLTSKFNFQANSAQTLYLRAATDSSTTTEKAFFKPGGTGADVYVILSNTTTKPTVAAITDAKAASPTAATNTNCIAYKVTGVVLTGATTGSPTFNNATSQYEISALPGSSAATTTIATGALANTYSYDDSAGTYQAIVTLTVSST